MERRNWLIRMLSGLLLTVAAGSKAWAERLSPQPRKPLLFRFPGGRRIDWDEQQGGDVIVHILFNKEGDLLQGLELWEIDADQPPFKAPLPSGYRPVNAKEVFALVPSWDQDRQTDQLRACLELRSAIRLSKETSPWQELANLIGRNQPMSPEAKQFLSQEFAKAGWMMGPGT